ncbi:MAG: cell division protein SepF [Acholeplasmataceae bacterium]|jgi:cell division inhibitor SepF
MSKKDEQTKLPRFQEYTVKTAFERIIFEDLDTGDDDYIVSLANELINGSPLVVNFEKLDIDEANKVIAFLSGVMFAVGGKIERINSRIFLFARAQEFKDGTLKQFVDEYKTI